MPRKLESLTIYDLIPFMKDGWLVYQPEHKLGGYTESMTVFGQKYQTKDLLVMQDIQSTQNQSLESLNGINLAQSS